MSVQPGSGDFTLSVEFAGLCLYVVDRRQAPSVSVLMPTCVPTPNGRVKTEHEDKTNGARHVPYLLANLANFGQNVPPGPAGDGPQFGVVRRLSREELFFEPEEQTSSQVDPDLLPLPDFGVYKGSISLQQALLGDIPPNDRPELNVRTVLKGGTLSAITGTPAPGRDPSWDQSEADWAGSIGWTRTIPGRSLTIRIRNWDTGQETPLTLTPVARGGRPVIELKIANLCEDNALEWKEFEPKFDRRDVDFKWLYRLFAPNAGASILAALGKKELPYPLLKPRGARTTGNTGCTGGKIGLP
jgi:hypothetical protein